MTDKGMNKPNNDLQAQEMVRRQSAPRPTAATWLNRMIGKKTNEQITKAEDDSINAFDAVAMPIKVETIHKATQTLQQYKQGKANLEARIVENEDWYKLRHWANMRKSSSNEVEPTSAWLFNCIANKHADAMDNFPSPNILPREESDKGEAEMLSSIVPVILSQNDFERTYDEVWNYKLKTGTGVYGVFWNASKCNGLGDIEIKRIDLLNLFWEPGITDIQNSKNLFNVEIVDNDILEARYPMLKGKLGQSTISISEYRYDDSVDTTNKSVVIDWYYKKSDANGKPILHYCKYVNDTILFATENDEMYRNRGFYDHAKYPFVFDTLFKVEGTPAGFGYIDIGKSAQEYIDRGNQAIMQSMLVNARPRFFINSSGSVNEEEFADMSKPFIHVDGQLASDSIVPVRGNTLSDVYVSVINNKIDELKETTGNRDISTGGSTSGVTAASAIAAMQEAGSKLSRDANKSAYRAFREICLISIELIRQFYDLPRCFRIVGNGGATRFVRYSNQGIQPQAQGNDFGMDLGARLPIFDIEVTAQKASPYSKMSQNELALQLYQAKFFDPNNSIQVLSCLEMMDFEDKNNVIARVQENSTLYQQMMALAQMVDQMRGTNEVSVALAQQLGITAPAMPNYVDAVKSNALGGSSEMGEAKNVTESRKRVAESTSPV